MLKVACAAAPPVIVAVFLAATALGCGERAASGPTVPGVPPVSQVPDACAGDAPWLVAIVGAVPDKSNAIFLDHALRDPQLGPAIAQGQGREMDGDSLWLRTVSWSSEESYEFDRGYNQHDDKVIVARNVTGKDPHTIGDVGSAPAFGAERRLASGVVEFPPNPALGKDGQRALFVFPDRTWVIVGQWMQSRFEAVFAGTSASPPLPPSPADTYVEYCFPKGTDGGDAKKNAGIKIRSEHAAGRFHVGQLPNMELSYTLATPELAARTEAEQRARCTQDPDCRHILNARIDGRVLRYTVR